ncbi:Conserved_hypothetical protein [Hexamita inflata]|uniref:Uncharacterized protein n=1 Tax=Hexamita inflata TaxID=28002 RepID=A0AA86R8V1_9EUKA|nr:Conserved hypothetical protein [Hexamita inflata]
MNKTQAKNSIRILQLSKKIKQLNMTVACLKGQVSKYKNNLVQQEQNQNIVQPIIQYNNHPLFNQIMQKHEHFKTTQRNLQSTDQDKNLWMIRLVINRQYYELDVSAFNAPSIHSMQTYLNKLQTQVLLSSTLINTKILIDKQRINSYRHKYNIKSEQIIKGVITIGRNDVYKSNQTKYKNVGEYYHLEKITDATQTSLISYMFVSINDDQRALPLVFHVNEQLYDQDVSLNIKLIKQYLEDYNCSVLGCIDSERLTPLNIDSYLSNKTRTLNLLYKNEEMVPIMDPKSLMYKIYLKYTEKPVYLTFGTEGKLFDFQELFDIFYMEPKCFDKRAQLFYMLPYQAYSADNIKYMLNHQNSQEDILPLLYFILVYPLSIIFTQIDEVVYQKMLTLSLSTFIKLFPITVNAENQNRVMPFSSELIKECIFTLSFILKAINYNEKVNFAAISNFQPTCYFKDLRSMLVQQIASQNASPNLYELVNKKEILDYCFEMTGTPKPDSFSSSGSLEKKKTHTFAQTRILKDDEIKEIERINKAIIQVLQGHTGIIEHGMILKYLKELFTPEIKEDIFENKAENENEAQFAKIKDKKYQQVTNVLQSQTKIQPNLPKID